MQPKPAHLGREYAAQFEDPSVAAVYHTRPPYPAELFDVLKGLVCDPGLPVLDLGCGTGEVALPLAARGLRVDAIDPSSAMLDVARSRPGASDGRIEWQCACAEDATLADAYGLAVAGESFHWMDWPRVSGRLAGCLPPNACLALLVGRSLDRVPWAEALRAVIPRYSTNQAFAPYDLVTELSRRGLFEAHGRHVTRPVPFEQPIDDYVESFHSRNGFSRDRMARVQARAFDDAVRALVLEHASDGVVRGELVSSIVWGRPFDPVAGRSGR